MPVDGAQNGDGRLTLSPDVVATVLQQEAVLLDLQSKFFYSVNASGWAITQLFEGGTTRADVRAHCRTWGAPVDDMAAIDRFVDALLENRLAVPADAPAAENGVTFAGPWLAPMIDKHKEPLQRIMISAFDPSVPLAE